MSDFVQDRGYYRRRITKIVNILTVTGASDVVLEKELAVRGADPALWKLVYVERGNVNLTVDGVAYALEPNSMLMHRKSEFVLGRAPDSDAPSVMLLEFFSVSPSLLMFDERKTFVGIHDRKYLSSLFRECQMTFAPNSGHGRREASAVRPDALFGGEQTIINRLEILFIELMREEQRRSTSTIISKETITNKTVLAIIGMLEERLYEKITLDEISDRISYSKSYLSRLFHSVCGYSIMEYYGMIKIEEAKRLIRETDYNFSQISERLRFDNPHYFSIVFKRTSGMTPSEYARRARRG